MPHQYADLQGARGPRDAAYAELGISFTRNVSSHHRCAAVAGEVTYEAPFPSSGRTRTNPTYEDEVFYAVASSSGSAVPDGGYLDEPVYAVASGGAVQASKPRRATGLLPQYRICCDHEAAVWEDPEYAVATAPREADYELASSDVHADPDYALASNDPFFNADFEFKPRGTGFAPGMRSSLSFGHTHVHTEPVYTFANPSSQSLIDHPDDEQQNVHGDAATDQPFYTTASNPGADADTRADNSADLIPVMDVPEYAIATDPGTEPDVPGDAAQMHAPRERSSTANSWDAMAARLRKFST